MDLKQEHEMDLLFMDEMFTNEVPFSESYDNTLEELAMVCQGGDVELTEFSWDSFVQDTPLQSEGN